VDDGFGRNIANQIREAGVDIGHVIWFLPPPMPGNPREAHEVPPYNAQLSAVKKERS
jgi:hypothetical protein